MADALNALAEYETALREVVAAVDAEHAAGDAPIDASTHRSVRGALDAALRAIPRDSPLTGPTASSLARMIIDGNGPRDPRHPIYVALQQMDESRTVAARETGRLALLSRSALRALAETPTGSKSRARLLALFAVRDPETTDGTDGGTGSVSGSDGGARGDSAADSGAPGPHDRTTDDLSPAYTSEDGKPYVPWTSHEQVAQYPDAEPGLTAAAAERGLTMADLYHLVHERPVTSLSPDEALVVLDVRESVPPITGGETMQKVLGHHALDDLLNRTYARPGSPLDTVGGFVSRAADAQKLLKSDDLALGFGVDYGPGRTIPDEFLAPDGSVGDVFAVRFEMPDSSDVRAPAQDAGNQAGLLFDRSGEPYYQPSSVDPLGPDNPYHGNKFVGNGTKEIIPEYHLPQRVPLNDGTEIWRVTPAGDEILVAARVGGQWVRF